MGSVSVVGPRIGDKRGLHGQSFPGIDVLFQSGRKHLSIPGSWHPLSPCFQTEILIVGPGSQSGAEGRTTHWDDRFVVVRGVKVLLISPPPLLLNSIISSFSPALLQTLCTHAQTHAYTNIRFTGTHGLGRRWSRSPGRKLQLLLLVHWLPAKSLQHPILPIIQSAPKSVVTPCPCSLTHSPLKHTLICISTVTLLTQFTPDSRILLKPASLSTHTVISCPPHLPLTSE